MDTPHKLVGRLMSDIGAVAADIQGYVRRSGADFTRTRLIGAGGVIRALVCMGAGTLGRELADGWLDAPSPPSAPAFCQARAKLEPEALRQLLVRFVPDAPARAMPGGLRLAAVDESPRGGLKHRYAVNFAAAVRACRAELWPRAGSADDLLERIAANVCPVRPGRSFARHRRLWSPGNYAYRC